MQDHMEKWVCHYDGMRHAHQPVRLGQCDGKDRKEERVSVSKGGCT